MTTPDAARAEQLSRAWERLQPDDDEVRFAATRIAARLQRPSRRAARLRRAAAISGAVILVTAMAYAAQAGRAWVQRALEQRNAPARLTSPAPRPMVVPRRDSIASVPPMDVVDSARPVPAVQRSLPPGHPKRIGRTAAQAPEPVTPEATQSSPGTRSEGDSASWRLVDRALTDRDDARAQALLERLVAASEDPRTRAAARLGLAQLLAGRGECSRARSIAIVVATEPGVPMAIARRAQRVLETCFAR